MLQIIEQTLHQQSSGLLHKSFTGHSWILKLLLHGGPPKGMTCHIYEFNPQAGGTFRMSFNYQDINHEVTGKSSEHADIFHGRFLELVPGKRLLNG
ncbi:MAG: hypothetical protein WDM78_21150 [Puia sp.]